MLFVQIPVHAAVRAAMDLDVVLLDLAMEAAMLAACRVAAVKIAVLAAIIAVDLAMLVAGFDVLGGHPRAVMVTADPPFVALLIALAEAPVALRQAIMARAAIMMVDALAFHMLRRLKHRTLEALRRLSLHAFHATFVALLVALPDGAVTRRDLLLAALFLRRRRRGDDRSGRRGSR
ncbi:MAG: hypothetical protein M3Q08_18215 [Pseudomonadota bacterium]|nr:hypothetical protein [Pseudomonadota bacterium]